MILLVDSTGRRSYHVLVLFYMGSSRVGWNDFSLPACGEYYDNEDGSSRQAELARCEPGDWLQLVREPENPHDPLAVGIFTTRGVRVGYLSRERAGWIGSKIDRGYDVRAIVERVKGAHLAGSALGLVMRLNMEGEEPELPATPNRVRLVA